MSQEHTTHPHEPGVYSTTVPLALFNSVKDSHCYKAYIDLCQDHIDSNTAVTIYADRVTSIINDLSLMYFTQCLAGKETN